MKMTPEAGQGELSRLFQWISDNPELWKCICNLESLELSVRDRLELLESLEKAGLYAVAYVVFNADWSDTGAMEMAREQFVIEMAAGYSPEELFARIHSVMRRAVAKSPDV